MCFDKPIIINTLLREIVNATECSVELYEHVGI